MAKPAPLMRTEYEFNFAFGTSLCPHEFAFTLIVFVNKFTFMAIFCDTHAHLDYPDYAGDLEEVLQRAEAAGITRVIAIGTDHESSARAVKLSERFPPVF